MSEYDEAAAAIRAAAPVGWYLGEPFIHVGNNGSWRPREVFSVEARGGGVFATGHGVATRLVTVELKAHTVEELVALVRRLKDLEWMLELPFGTELTLSLYDT